MPGPSPKLATFSITDDFEQTVTSFQINGALGVGVSGPLLAEPSPGGGYNVVADGQLISMAGSTKRARTMSRARPGGRNRRKRSFWLSPWARAHNLASARHWP
jgi:hypothetical protein